jgi:hypothetical protein
MKLARGRGDQSILNGSKLSNILKSGPKMNKVRQKQKGRKKT